MENLSLHEVRTLLHSNGHVLWIPPAILKTSCVIDVRYFPFDQQTRHNELGSWTYTKDLVGKTLSPRELNILLYISKLAKFEILFLR